MKRLHNTDANGIAIGNRPYPQDGKQLKPKGLWYAIDDAWLEWCRSEMPHWVKPNTFELDIDLSRVLVLQDSLQVQAFHERFGISLFESLPDYKTIDWRKVTKYYAGVEIQSYEYSSLRYEYNWYYGWDCSSGCIWDLACVKAVRKVKLQTA